MRKLLFAANWKMNLTPAEGRTLLTALRANLDPDAATLARDREVMVAPPFLAIPAAAQALAGYERSRSARKTSISSPRALSPAKSRPRC